MVERLSKNEIRRELKKVKGWKVEKDKFSECSTLQRKFVFKSFLSAVKFLNKTAKAAEKYGHHPDMHLIRWNHVIINIYTHSEGGITEWDFELAKLISKIK